MDVRILDLDRQMYDWLMCVTNCSTWKEHPGSDCRSLLLFASGTMVGPLDSVAFMVV